MANHGYNNWLRFKIDHTSGVRNSKSTRMEIISFFCCCWRNAYQFVEFKNLTYLAKEWRLTCVLSFFRVAYHQKKMLGGREIGVSLKLVRIDRNWPWQRVKVLEMASIAHAIYKICICMLNNSWHISYDNSIQEGLLYWPYTCNFHLLIMQLLSLHHMISINLNLMQLPINMISWFVKV